VHLQKTWWRRRGRQLTLRSRTFRTDGVECSSETLGLHLTMTPAKQTSKLGGYVKSETLPHPDLKSIFFNGTSAGLRATPAPS